MYLVCQALCTKIPEKLLRLRLAIGYGNMVEVNEVLAAMASDSETIRITGWELTLAMIQPDPRYISIPIIRQHNFVPSADFHQFESSTPEIAFRTCMSNNHMIAVASHRMPSESHYIITQMLLQYPHADFSQDIDINLIIYRLLRVHDYGKSLERALRSIKPLVSDEEVERAMGDILMHMAISGDLAAVSLLLDKWRCMCKSHALAAFQAALAHLNSGRKRSMLHLIKTNCHLDMNQVVKLQQDCGNIPLLIRLGADPQQVSTQVVQDGLSQLPLDKVLELYKFELITKFQVATKFIQELRIQITSESWEDEIENAIGMFIAFIQSSPVEIRNEIRSQVAFSDLDIHIKNILMNLTLDSAV